jgi:hypothetical protein
VGRLTSPALIVAFLSWLPAKSLEASAKRDLGVILSRERKKTAESSLRKLGGFPFSIEFNCGDLEGTTNPRIANESDSAWSYQDVT